MAESIQCLIVDDEHIAREIVEKHLSKVPGFEIAASCKSVPEAFHIINTKPINLIFLDINLPDISGLSFAKSITRNTKIIFTTAYREYAVDGFDLQAVDYLLKPISFERMLQAINKYMNENSPMAESQQEDIYTEKNDFFFVRSDRKMMRINFNEILYIESLGDYLKIYLKNKKVVTRETITNIEAKLPQKDFIRVHRSYIVALACVDAFTHEDITVGGTEIPISRSYKKEVFGRLEEPG